MTLWPTIRRIDSVDTNVAKFVFERDDAVAESVLYKYPTYADRTVICCSTMSGCPVGCRFCGAGDTMETTAWTRTTVEVEWSIYGPGGPEDKITAVTIGVADDNADKSVNKAMTAAFKNVLLRVLCIGDPQDDTDSYQRQPEDYNDPEPAEWVGCLNQTQAEQLAPAIQQHYARKYPHLTPDTFVVSRGTTRVNQILRPDVTAREYVEYINR